MKCFQHTGSDALGICRGCGKGVCAQCARELPFGLACSDPCSERVAQYERLNRKAGTTYRTASRNAWVGPLYFAAMGALMLGFGVWGQARRIDFLVAIGALFLVFGAVFYLRNRRWARDVGNET